MTSRKRYGVGRGIRYSVGTSGQEECPIQDQQGDAFVQQSSLPDSPANARRRAAAHTHLDNMFDAASKEEIEGRRFYGRIILEIPFEGGTAQEICASKIARDRVSGGR